ncbi:unnamed protein product [[Candida] boidinii]|uniref:Multifunctional tryptophan biosynthesis protein n=1 Tax=Candida boidinii TaxID=5477 RepID=A0A9W6WH81_CANBO|nr:hypothetical protein BVG19_g4580 [[Candida] boidinii]OWB51764.1 indole-3-glycerol-phosphate synthase activity protein [[Candida] boidinii]OWB66298.1 indole-3-glycerol-phosphate synthase activity protein [[Candida] boidinii]OWB83758.1 indole-3-glycerol-phosphate synthase activity protein [[Candida] boidinii]GME71856.1 unnamed protein product [[Candida] boidinii]
MTSLPPINRKVLMIDNYDSFTWNLYQFLSQEGADVEVFRNDQITIEEIEAKQPEIILISPGPGHPKTDSGISRDVIQHFKGKIPVFGVCMGQQCIYEVFGGNVEFAGEIVHGKTSTIEHDNKGMFKNVPQGIAITRYHSLAGSKQTLPDELEVTARTSNGIIMGVRHKKYTVEGVQFHPESILTEEGHLMIRNILSVRGGYWDKQIEDEETKTSINNNSNEKIIISNEKKSESILTKIFEQRKKDYELIMNQPGKSFEDLNKYYKLNLSPKLISFYDKLNKIINEKNEISILSEIKRASPSKGDINLQINSVDQALNYANSSKNIAAISVLTEPNWFKGSIEDLRLIRLAIDSIEDRPCILRKEFIFNKYQILEARLNGADTVLLIVKMLEFAKLKELYDYSLELGMEPLVEINNIDELKLAVELDCKIIGVNNRNLNNFNVDLNTTKLIKDSLIDNGGEKDRILISLSGINTKEDIADYKKSGINGFLIGEALMRKGDKVGEFINELVNA